MTGSAVPGRKCSVLLAAPPVKPGGVPDAAAGSACTRNKAQRRGVRLAGLQIAVRVSHVS